jgi:hypothetical protein
MDATLCEEFVGAAGVSQGQSAGLTAAAPTRASTPSSLTAGWPMSFSSRTSGEPAFIVITTVLDAVAAKSASGPARAAVAAASRPGWLPLDDHQVVLDAPGRGSRLR